MSDKSMDHICGVGRVGKGGQRHRPYEDESSNRTNMKNLICSHC